MPEDSDFPSHAPLQIDWHQAQGDHLVQTYSSDAVLIETLSSFVGDALSRGDSAIVICTNAHRTALEHTLDAKNVDLAAHQSFGRYIALDARETLERFLVDGSPDQDRFLEVISPVVSQAEEL